eukprot:gene4897-3915_t
MQKDRVNRMVCTKGPLEPHGLTEGLLGPHGLMLARVCKRATCTAWSAQKGHLNRIGLTFIRVWKRPLEPHGLAFTQVCKVIRTGWPAQKYRLNHMVWRSPEYEEPFDLI